MAVFRHLLWITAVYQLLQMGNTGVKKSQKSTLSMKDWPLPSVKRETPYSARKRQSHMKSIQMLYDYVQPSSPAAPPGDEPHKHLNDEDIPSVHDVITSSDIKLFSGPLKDQKSSAILKETNYNMTKLQQRPRRAVGAKVATFALETIAGYFIEKVLDMIFSPIFDDSTSKISELISEVGRIDNKINALSYNLRQVSNDLWNIFFQVSHNRFVSVISILSSKVRVQAEYLKLNSSLPSRRDHILEEILHPTMGIERALANLDLAVRGQIQYDGKNIFEMYLQRLTNGKDLENFEVDGTIRKKMADFITYHRYLREEGFIVWSTAIRLKYGNSAALIGHLNVWNDTRNRHVESQIEAINTLFPNCDTLSLPNYPNRSQSLVCSVGSEFGSICEQRCSDDIHYSENGYDWPQDDKFYPNIGYAPVQCLMDGRWSHNIAGRTEVGCTFNMIEESVHAILHVFEFVGHSGKTYQDVTCANGFCTEREWHFDISVYYCFDINHQKYSCRSTVKPGYTISGSRCVSQCAGYLMRFFCYTNYEGDWESCMPDVINRYYTRITIWGKECTTRPKRNISGYLYCYTDEGWDYCS